jgi:uncharacterized protein
VLTLADVRGGQCLTLDQLRLEGLDARPVQGPPGRPSQPVLRPSGEGRLTVDGESASHLDGLLDVDLEASACTNTLPIHRLSLPRGEVTEAPAAYVRALDPSVTRLDQTCRPLDDRR